MKHVLIISALVLLAGVALAGSANERSRELCEEYKAALAAIDRNNMTRVNQLVTFELQP